MLSHVNEQGQPVMVDVGDKAVTRRTATARAVVAFPPEVLSALVATRTSPGGDLISAKGPVFATAIVAGIQGAKLTSQLIPLCHPLPLDGIAVTCDVVSDHEVVVICTTKTTHKTGVEMEALTGASVAALTLYDMTKALSHAIVIGRVELVGKTGGKRDYALR